jgi:predicted phage tail protein
MPVRKLTLHGQLGAQFGGPYKLCVDSPSEGVYALAMQMGPHFASEFMAGSYFLQVARQPVEDLMQCVAPSTGDIDIYPAIMAAGGEKGKSVGLIIAGTILLGAAVVLSGGALAPVAAGAAMSAGGLALSAAASIGAGLILTGITGLLSPVPQMQDISGPRESGGKGQSFLFHGAVNREAEGGVVPLIFGRCIVGSIKIGGGTTVTSSISEGVEYIVLDQVPVGEYAYNFVLPHDSNLGTLPVTRFGWTRRDKSATETEWQWEIGCEWYGSTIGEGLPRTRYFRADLFFTSDDGISEDGDLGDDWYATRDGVRYVTKPLTLDPGRKYRHTGRFYIHDGDGDNDPIIIKDFVSRLKRLS